MSSVIEWGNAPRIPAYCDLQVGDRVTCEWDKGRCSHHEIIGVHCTPRSQSGVSYQIRPAFRNCTERHLIDAAWFRPAPPTLFD